MNENITLDHGGGGYKSWEIVKDIRKIIKSTGEWRNSEDDGAIFNIPKNSGNLVFTTDAFIVDPLFFPGGDIGKIAMCGTINDISVMGARPIGVSLSIVMEEGFSRADFVKIIKSINKVSVESGVPVVTGDTKVTEKGKIDKIEITTAGIGLVDEPILNGGMKVGDFVVVSGNLGDHAVALLAKRFKYETKIKSDCKPLNKELLEVGKYLNACKDPTRGGLAANLVEMAEKSNVKVILDEKMLPYRKETIAITELLGLDVFSLASEGRFVASVSLKNLDKALDILKKFNKEAKVIGLVENGRGLFLKTKLETLRPIEMPKGKLIPRIC